MLPDIHQIIHQIVEDPKSFWKGFVVPVLVALLAKIGLWLRDAIVEAWHTRHAFDISGTWIGDCWLPSYPEPQLEIWQYRRKGDQVKLKFFSYDPRNESPQKWLGGGVYRGSKFSAYYYMPAANTYESGVVALELKALGLKGVYAQFDPKTPDEPLYASQPDYQQRRIQLLFYPRLRMFLGAPPFGTHADVKKLFEAVYGSSTPKTEKQSSSSVK